MSLSDQILYSPDSWEQVVVKPMAKRTQDAAGRYPAWGVGPFCAAVRWHADAVCVTGGRTLKIAAERMRAQGGTPLYGLDYIHSAEYFDTNMRELLQKVERDAIEERVAIIGGESSAHDSVSPHSYVWLIGVMEQEPPAS